MKILEILSYIKLPDDFKGNYIDAMQWYIDYLKSEKREQLEFDLGKTFKELTLDEYLEKMYNLLIEKNKTRSGIIRLIEYDNDNSKWKEIKQ